jgi:CubicO group peptidase (beta-lactamase class C family)
LGIRWRQNPVYAKGYGYANREEKAPTDATTIFRIASLTKQFTAAAIMQLVEQGKVGLDDPLTTYYPEARAAWDDVTVRHLLTHTSGIPDPEDLPATTIDTGLRFPDSAEELVASLKDTPLTFEPGTQFQYGNAGYGLLSGIIEQVSGWTTEKYFQVHLFEPLDLDSTFNCLEHFEGVAQGYRIVGQDLLPTMSYNPSRLLGGTGLCSTVGDLVRWQQALATGQVVSVDSYQEMITPTRLASGEVVPYGFGLVVDERAVAHGGGTGGFRSLLAHFPEGDLTIVLLANTDLPASGSLETLAAVIAARVLSEPGE